MSAGELEAAWDYAGSAGRVNSGRVIAESLIEFEYEITLLTVRSRNPKSGAIETSYCEPVGSYSGKPAIMLKAGNPKP